jgi:hypothetical protein
MIHAHMRINVKIHFPSMAESAGLAANDPNDDALIRPMGPLFRRIYERVEQLRREIEGPARPGIMPAGMSTKRPRTDVEKRCNELERYMWRKPEFRPGRPARNKVGVLNAYDDWLADPKTSWGQLAKKYGFKDRRALECELRRLRRILKREGITIPDRAKHLPS